MEARMTSDITAGTDSDRLIDRLDLCLAAALPASEHCLCYALATGLVGAAAAAAAVPDHKIRLCV